MRRLVLSILNAEGAPIRGPANIAAGIAILTAAALWPGVPAVTALALVAIGATDATLARFRGSAAIVPVSLAHLAIYGGLYAIFVGASLHGAATSSSATLPIASFADIAFSIIPSGLALNRVWGGLLSGRPE